MREVGRSEIREAVRYEALEEGLVDKLEGGRDPLGKLL